MITFCRIFSLTAELLFAIYLYIDIEEAGYAVDEKAMVLFDEKQYKRIETFAKTHHISVGQAIRNAVDAVVLKKGNAEERMKAAMRLTSTKDVDADWDEVEQSIKKGHAG